MSRPQKDGNDGEHRSLRHVVDRIIDYISSSKSMLHILSDKQAVDEKKTEAAKRNTKEAIRRKLLKEFLTGDKGEGHELTQLHINESFKDRTDSNVRCSAVYNAEQFVKRNESTNQRRMSTNFLDEQYNLTKQAIARRYRPQMKINSISTKSNIMRDYFDEPYDQDYHRICNVSSEKIPVYQVKRNHTKKADKILPAKAEEPSNIETYVIYEKN